MELTPLSELFSRSWRLLTQRLKVYVSVMLLRAVANLLLGVLLSLGAMGYLGALMAKGGVDVKDPSVQAEFTQIQEVLRDGTTNDEDRRAVLEDFLEKYITPNLDAGTIALGAAGFLLALFAGLLLQSFFYSALCYAVVDQDVGVSGAVGTAVKNLVPFAVVFFLQGLLILVGYLCFIIPGVFAMIFFILAPFTFFFEEKRGFGALKRSKELVQDHKVAMLVRILAPLVVVMIVSLVVIGVPSLLFGGDVPFIREVLGFFTGPFLMIFYYLVYIDLRHMKEPGGNEAGPAAA